MNSLKDKTCYLRSATQKSSKNAGRYDNFVKWISEECREQQKVKVINFRKERKKGSFLDKGIKSSGLSFNLHFDNCGKFMFQFEF